MTTTFPSVKGRTISPKRWDEVKRELLEALTKYSVARRVLRVVSVDDEPDRALKTFGKVGISHIAEKIWFVDNTFEGHYFTVSGIGTSYGLTIAKAETSELLSQLRACDTEDNRIGIKEQLSPHAIETARMTLLNRGFGCNVVLTNVKDHVGLWNFPEYGKGPEGHTYVNTAAGPVLVEFAPEIPDGLSFVLDRNNFGAFVVKKDLTASITEIADDDRPELLRELPGLTLESLFERVRLLIYEIIRIDIDNPRACVTLIHP